VHYAIADLTAFIEPGGLLDIEAHRRGESLYGADSLVPLHPRELSEGAASLLPDQVRPAYLWTITLDAEGAQTDARVERALVRSRQKLDYAGAQELVDRGDGGTVLDLLKQVGTLRVHQEAARGGVNLPMPEQVVDCSTDPWRLEFRELLDVETWNAQISLLTGFAAASMMVYGRIGILRTLPPPPPEAVTRLHRTARALGIDWPAEQTYPDFIRSLDPAKPSHAAMTVASTTLLRGAGYAAFDGELPAQPEHAALASEYAHVTAPLRRLVDRYGLEVCAALCAGTEVPTWVREGLHALPETMQRSNRLASAYENAVLDLVEAATLQGRTGERFAGVVVAAERDDPRKGDAVVRDPAVEARVAGEQPLPVGEDVELVLAEADPATRRVRFTLPGPDRPHAP
jgi:exoribonuclease R